MLTCEEIMTTWREICSIYDSETIIRTEAPVGTTADGDKITAKLLSCDCADKVPETLAAIAMLKISHHDGRIYGEVEKWAKRFDLPSDLYDYENLCRVRVAGPGFKDWYDHIHTAHIQCMISHYINHK